MIKSGTLDYISNNSKDIVVIIILMLIIYENVELMKPNVFCKVFSTLRREGPSAK